jgi:hypothetical protein
VLAAALNAELPAHLGHEHGGTPVTANQHFDIVTDELIGPSLNWIKSVGDLTQSEASVMKRAVVLGDINAVDVADILPDSPSQRSVSRRRLIDRSLLVPTREGSWYYRPSLCPNDLTVHIVRRLDSIVMLPSILKN